LSSTCPKLLPPLSFIMMSRERAISPPGKSRSAKWSLGGGGGALPAGSAVPVICMPGMAEVPGMAVWPCCEWSIAGMVPGAGF
jgi:hypothetical protein